MARLSLPIGVNAVREELHAENSEVEGMNAFS